MNAGKKILEKQGYRFTGEHSSVKICGWTKNSILNKGNCYKHKFYGINTNQCVQMTPSMVCPNRCVFLLEIFRLLYCRRTGQNR